ncbi:class I SAM-dependent methyltransferase [Pseudonocardia sp. TRM90224]|uniref:class I SAM-dependent methyltransferase n=1 Tax=Pseudonocardia sp. TRM90224 TaxID=2812678 RepID=UPI001E4B0727|nr:class I SAM-dependent methyltransferase [Pseudonocardia sp. TRM90224]
MPEDTSGPPVFAGPEDLHEFEGLADLERRMDTSAAVLAQVDVPVDGTVLHLGIQGGAWLAPLAAAVGPAGRVTVTGDSSGTPEEEEEEEEEEELVWMSAATARVVADAGLTNVRFVHPATAFDGRLYDVVVSFRALYGRPIREWDDFIDRALAVTRPGGTLVVVEYDYRNWHYAPPAPALELLSGAIQSHAQERGDVDFTMDRIPGIFLTRAMVPELHADCAALPPGNLLLTKPVSAAATGTGISDPVRAALGDDEVERMRAAAHPESIDPERWTFAPLVLAAWARLPAPTSTDDAPSSEAIS